jgi:hypothetical protein
MCVPTAIAVVDCLGASADVAAIEGVADRHKAAVRVDQMSFMRSNMEISSHAANG